MGLSKAGTGNRKWLRSSGIHVAHLGASGYDDLDGMKRVQQDLHESGYYAGAIDGFFWQGSCRAFRAANIGKVICGEKLLDPPEGVEFLNYWHEPVKELRSTRSIKADQILLHESVSSTWSKTIDVLSRRHLGVHLAVRKDGTAVQHCDLEKATIHAGGKHNKRSIAIEAISSYYGRRAKSGDVVVDAVWAHKKSYILPSSVMCDTIWRLVEWLCEHTDVPLVFPAMEIRDQFRWGRGEWRQKGILAHHRSAHADGCFVEHYCVCRSLGADHGLAWDLSVQAASAGKRLTTYHHQAVK